jgi:hypothetical protein
MPRPFCSLPSCLSQICTQKEILSALVANWFTLNGGKLKLWNGESQTWMLLFFNAQSHVASKKSKLFWQIQLLSWIGAL